MAARYPVLTYCIRMSTDIAYQDEYGNGVGSSTSTWVARRMRYLSPYAVSGTLIPPSPSSLRNVWY
eukprot:2158206-Rhodomonas_salina.6